MKELKCVICGMTEDEVEHMIGIEYNPEDHENKKDVALCDECIIEAHNILTDAIFRKKLQEELLKLQEKESEL